MTGQELEGRTTIEGGSPGPTPARREETPYYAIINGENNALVCLISGAERFPNLHLLEAPGGI